MNNDSLRNEPALRRAERGYNLVEVLVAMGILASVMISIFTLFFMGRYNVYSGKQMTQAVGIANRVLEDLAPLNKKMIYNGAFSINDTDTGLGTPIVFGNPGGTYNNSLIRSTDPNIQSGISNITLESVGTGAPVFLEHWNQQLSELGGQKLPISGYTPPNTLPAGAPATTLYRYANNASVTVIFTPRNDTAGNSPAQFGTAATMRIRVLVRWMERNRQRQVAVDTVKSY